VIDGKTVNRYINVRVNFYVYLMSFEGEKTVEISKNKLLFNFGICIRVQFDQSAFLVRINKIFFIYEKIYHKDTGRGIAHYIFY